MGKSCRNCRYYNGGLQSCYNKEIHIIDKMSATYCKTYKDKRKISEGIVKCAKCKFLNKYGWCSVKKKCFNEDERGEERRCIKFEHRYKKKGDKWANKKKK